MRRMNTPWTVGGGKCNKLQSVHFTKSSIANDYCGGRLGYGGGGKGGWVDVGSCIEAMAAWMRAWTFASSLSFRLARLMDDLVG